MLDAAADYVLMPARTCRYAYDIVSAMRAYYCMRRR